MKKIRLVKNILLVFVFLIIISYYTRTYGKTMHRITYAWLQLIGVC